MNKMNTNDTLNRMKSLMNYGLQTESKQAPYSTVEYQKTGADGKVYGIVREGAKYYIKTAPSKANLVKEDFNYIGGFRNRKDNEYSSYANAQKQFDLKMMSLKEAYNNPSFNVESWDLNKKEMVVTEASDKMKGEILRERQIMKNAMAINEKKAVCCDAPGCPTDNIKSEKPKTGDAKDAVDHEKAELPKEMGKVAEAKEVLGWHDSHGNPKGDHYMDKSHGTEIGDSAPFDDATAKNIDNQDKKVSKTGEMKNGVVENHGTSMHDTDNQNSPAVGVGEGPSDDNNDPFDDKKGKQIDEAIDDFGGEEGADDLGGEEPMGDDLGGEEGAADLGGEEPMGDDLGGEDLEGGDLGDELGDEGLDDEGDDVYEDDLESRMDALEELIGAIADKLGVSTPAVDEENYEDDELFDDEEGDEGFEDEGDFDGEDFGDEDEFGGEDFEGEDDFGGEEFGDEEPIEDDVDFQTMGESRRRNGVQIFETAAYKRAMRKQRMNEEGMTPFTDNGRVPSGNMNKLDDFGKHPAYQKVVMDLPPKDMQEFPGYYDMNDDSVRNDNPYGEKIGDGAPFDIDPESIDNAIAEAFDRLRRNKKKI